MTTVDVYSLDGKKVRQLQLPQVFESEVDEVLIKRAVLAIQTARIQRKGSNPRAGRDVVAKYIGARRKPTVHRTINIEKARLPRMKNVRYIISGQVARVPQAVHGPAAHPPKVEKDPKERINKREKKMARNAAIAAVAKAELVRKRGHKIEQDMKLPIVVENKIEELKKTKEVRKALEALNLWQDVERAKTGRKPRAGKGKRRGRKYKTPKSLLIVVEKPESIYKAARNLSGVEIVQVKNLNAELLAPGCQPGRLTLWSESAIKAL